MKKSELIDLIRESLNEYVLEGPYDQKKLKNMSKNELKKALLYHQQYAKSTHATIENWHHRLMVKKIEALLGITPS